MAQWQQAMHVKAEHQFFPTVSTIDTTGHFSISYNEDNFYTVYQHNGIDKEDLNTVTYDEIPGVLTSRNAISSKWK